MEKTLSREPGDVSSVENTPKPKTNMGGEVVKRTFDVISDGAYSPKNVIQNNRPAEPVANNAARNWKMTEGVWNPNQIINRFEVRFNDLEKKFKEMKDLEENIARFKQEIRELKEGTREVAMPITVEEGKLKVLLERLQEAQEELKKHHEEINKLQEQVTNQHDATTSVSRVVENLQEKNRNNEETIQSLQKQIQEREVVGQNLNNELTERKNLGEAGDSAKMQDLQEKVVYNQSQIASLQELMSKLQQGLENHSAQQQKESARIDTLEENHAEHERQLEALLSTFTTSFRTIVTQVNDLETQIAGGASSELWQKHTTLANQVRTLEENVAKLVTEGKKGLPPTPKGGALPGNLGEFEKLHSKIEEVLANIQKFQEQQKTPEPRTFAANEIRPLSPVEPSSQSKRIPNDLVREVFGGEPTEIIAAPAIKSYRAFMESGSPEDRAKKIELFRQLISLRESIEEELRHGNESQARGLATELQVELGKAEALWKKEKAKETFEEQKKIFILEKWKVTSLLRGGSLQAGLSTEESGFFVHQVEAIENLQGRIENMMGGDDTLDRALLNEYGTHLSLLQKEVAKKLSELGKKRGGTPVVLPTPSAQEIAAQKKRELGEQERAALEAKIVMYEKTYERESERFLSMYTSKVFDVDTGVTRYISNSRLRTHPDQKALREMLLRHHIIVSDPTPSDLQREREKGRIETIAGGERHNFSLGSSGALRPRGLLFKKEYPRNVPNQELRDEEARRATANTEKKPAQETKEQAPTVKHRAETIVEKLFKQKNRLGGKKGAIPPWAILLFAATTVGTSVYMANHTSESPVENPTASAPATPVATQESTKEMTPLEIMQHKEWYEYVSNKAFFADFITLDSPREIVKKYLDGHINANNPSDIERILNLDAFRVLNDPENYSNLSDTERQAIADIILNAQNISQAINAPSRMKATMSGIGIEMPDDSFATPQVSLGQYLTTVLTKVKNS